MNAKNIRFEVRDQLNNNVKYLNHQSWNEKPGRRKGESPQLDFGIVQSWSRNDLPFFKFFVMRDQRSIFDQSGKSSTGLATAPARNAETSSITLRNDELLQKIDAYFDYSGVAEPIETLGVLLDAFVATGDSDEPGYTPTFLRDVSWEVTRLSAFLAYLYEQRNFMVESVKVKGGENG